MSNIYAKSKISVRTITLARILLLLPLVIYGFYKNGIYLYLKGYVTVLGLFKPLVFMLGGLFIGLFINFVYELIAKKGRKKDLKNVFSSFQPEYGLILGMIVPIRTNIFIFFGVAFVVLILSKFMKNRINTVCLGTILMVGLTYLISNSVSYANNYELSNTFSLGFLDYFLGRASGGIAATNVLLMIVSFVILEILNNNKSSISISAIVSYVALLFIYKIIGNCNFSSLLFLNNILFIFMFVATDSTTSCYTKNGKILFGVLVGALTFGFNFVNPIVSPYLSVLIVSLFNNLIDRKIGVIKKEAK